MFFCRLLPLPFPASKKLFSLNILLQAEMRIVLCYLMASQCNPMAFNLRIPSFIVAFLRVRSWIVHYASEMETGRVDRHRSGRPAGRVEILQPAGQAGCRKRRICRFSCRKGEFDRPVKPVEKPVKFSFTATKRHLSTNRNILIYFIINKTLYKKSVLTNHTFRKHLLNGFKL